MTTTIHQLEQTARETGKQVYEVLDEIVETELNKIEHESNNHFWGICNAGNNSLRCAILRGFTDSRHSKPE